jgi:hypothetical protein
MFTKTSVNIGSITATVFLSHESGEYFYSLTSVADLIGKPPFSPSQFLASRAFKASHPEGFNPSQFSDETGATYKLLPCYIASSYLMYWCTKGDKLAASIVSSLMNESLELRARKAFNTLTVEEVEKVQQKTDDDLITELRVDAKSLHNLFQRACYSSNMNPSLVHDRITKLVFGYTAKEARELPMTDLKDEVWLNEAIGINHEHTKDKALMQIYRDVKTKIFSYRKGTWEEKVDRAYQEAIAS